MRRAIAARRAGALPRVAQAARGLRSRRAVEEEPPEVAVAVVAAAVVVAAVSEQEIEKNKD